MNKVAISLGLALTSLLVVAGSAMAQAITVQLTPAQTASPGSWQAPPPSTLSVAARDIQVSAQSDQTRQFAGNLIAEWNHTFGWSQSAPIYILVYRSGVVMASDVGWFRGMPMRNSELNDAGNRIGFTVRDARPFGPGGGAGGWIITLNANYDGSIDRQSTGQSNGPTGTARGALTTEEQGFLVHELAGIMLQDITGTGGQEWLRAGVADLITNSEVTGLSTTATRQAALASAAGGGTVPGPIALANSWNTLSMGSGPVADAAYGMADQTAFYLVKRVGMQAVLSMLSRTAAGEDFNSVLQSTAGLTLQQLDAEMVSLAAA